MRNTFPQRLLAILQLCLIFTIVCWITLSPFVEKTLEQKSTQLLRRFLIGNSHTQIDLTPTDLASKEVLQRNHNRFLALTPEEQIPLLTTSPKDELSFSSQLIQSIQALFILSSPWLRCWLCFSLLCSIWLLKEYDGAQIASIALPLLAACWLYFSPPQAIHDAIQQLYPTEQQLLSLQSPSQAATSNLFQYHLLNDAWKHYLAKEWSLSGKDEEDGMWRFQLELYRRKVQIKKEPSEASRPLLALFFYWNLFFTSSLLLLQFSHYARERARSAMSN